MESAAKNSMEPSVTIMCLNPNGAPRAPVLNDEKRESSDLINVDIAHFRKRLELELRLVQMIRHHLCFGIAFILVLVWMGIHMTSLQGNAKLCTALHHMMDNGPAAATSDLESRDFLGETISSVVNDFGKVYVVLKGQRNTLSPCEGTRYLNRAGRLPRSTYSQSCLSRMDETYLNATCTETDCAPACRTGPLEDIPIACMMPHPAFEDRGRWVVEVNSPNFSFALVPGLTLARLETSFLFNMSSMTVCIVDSVFSAPASRRSYLTILTSLPGKGPTMGFTISVLGFTGFSLAFDVKQIISRSRGRNCIPWISLVLFIMCSVSICLLISARWLFYDWLLRDHLATFTNVLDILDFRSYRMIVDCVSYVLVLIASGRFVHVSSAHPKTRIVFEIFFGRITEILKLFFSLLIVTGYFVFVFWWKRNIEPVLVLQWLVQIPLGVWPLTSANVVLVIIFGIVTYHFLVVLSQVIIASGVRRYTPCPTALSLHGDLYLIFRRFLVRKFFSSDPHWPSRQTLISVLRNVESHQKVVSLHDILTEVTRLQSEDTIHTENFSLRGVEEVWHWYVGHFGSFCLKPKKNDDISVEDILRYVEELPVPAESEVHGENFPVEEIARRTCELNSIIDRL